MENKTRGSWVPSISSSESQLRILIATHRLNQQGTVTKDVLAFAKRRREQTAQPRK